MVGWRADSVRALAVRGEGLGRIALPLASLPCPFVALRGGVVPGGTWTAFTTMRMWLLLAFR